MVMLDSSIRSLSLTLVDADDPNATMFSPGSVPIVTSPKRTVWFPDEPQTRDSPDGNENGCSCHQITLGEQWSSAAEHAPLWGSTPAWDESWTEGEIRKESCRRLCWSSMNLAAGHISYTTAHRSQGLDLFISDPANVSQFRWFFYASLTDILNNTSMHFFFRANLLLPRLRYPGIPRKTPFGHYMTALSSSGMGVSVCATMFTRRTTIWPSLH